MCLYPYHICFETRGALKYISTTLGNPFEREFYNTSGSAQSRCKFIQNNFCWPNNFFTAKGDTTFSTLVHQFHKSLVQHYTKGGKHLYDPNEMEEFCDKHAPNLFEYIFHTIYNDEKDAPSTKRTGLQRIRVVALLHNLSFFRNQVWFLIPTDKNHALE